MHGESASVDITSENIQNELRKIEELLGPCDPADIMNFDETGLYYQQPSKRTIRSESLGCLKKLNVAFGRQNRKIALLLNNASVHKISILLNNTKLLFLLANATSKLQALDAGIIDNFMAHFQAQQYDRALCLYIINAWLKVKPETVNGMLLDLPRNFDNKFTDVSQLNLEADESEMIVCCTTSTTNNEETTEGNIDETEENDNTEQDEQCVDIVVTTTVRNIPPCESEDEYNYNFLESIFRAIYNFHTTTIDIKDGEATFNSLFIYPFLEAVTTWLKESEDWCKAGFRHGETPLVSMGEQLKTLPLYKEDSHIYLADGIIKLNGVKNIEILLLETSGCFGSIDRSKIAFDHHKGLFGALAMLKSIADEFPMASMEAFQKCKTS
ncbi:hypothetical protein G6F43_002499 [Rhizopus delemar]|nr:hypothetical protein G6F43_002499 [Rhizopus delemar]